MIVHTNSRLARIIQPFGFAAICLGQHVFTWLPEMPPEMFAHEAKHVEQWRRHGALGFLVRYLWYQLRYGYHHNPFEIEARLAALRKGVDNA